MGRAKGPWPPPVDAALEADCIDEPSTRISEDGTVVVRSYVLREPDLDLSIVVPVLLATGTAWTPERSRDLERLDLSLRDQTAKPAVVVHAFDLARNTSAAINRAVAESPNVGRLFAIFTEDSYADSTWAEIASVPFLADSVRDVLDGSPTEVAVTVPTVRGGISTIDYAYAMGLGQLWKTALFREIGGRDETFPGSWRSDTDAVWRASDAGYEWLPVVKAIVRHPGPARSKLDETAERRLAERHPARYLSIFGEVEKVIALALDREEEEERGRLCRSA